jgi:two-component system copper resistance phosphate regulon response regulator CusR
VSTNPINLSPNGSVLVVDDEPDTVDLIRLTLETAGFTVHQAPDGTSAIQMIQNGTYDVVLLDIMMPDISGFDVLQQLRNQGVEVPPVVFLTARKQDEDRQTGQDMGASDYLTKPATRGELLDAIQHALEQ